MNLKKFLCSLSLSLTVITFGTTTQANVLSSSVAYEGTITNSRVLDGAQQFKGHYYKNFENQMAWEDAEEFCKSMGGHLATAENREEMIPIKKAVETGGQYEYWIGGYMTDRSIWKWVTGDVITDQNWNIGFPSYRLDHKPRMYVHRNQNGEWRDSTASDKKSFVCEWDSAELAHDSDW